MLPAGWKRNASVERIAERVRERDAWRPPGFLAKTRGIQRDPGGFAAAHARGVEFGADRDASEREERFEDLSDRDRSAGPDVERPALAEVQRGRVGTRHVADVQEVALRVEPAVSDDRFDEASLGLGDLLRERRRRETGVLPGSVLVGGPQDDDRCTMACRELLRERLGGDLRCGIDVGGTQRRILVNGHAFGRAVYIGARREHEARMRMVLEGGQHGRRAKHVDPHGRDWIGRCDRRNGDAGQMDHRVRL